MASGIIENVRKAKGPMGPGWEDDMQRITDEMARSMLRQMVAYDRNVKICTADLLDAKAYASIWRGGMSAIGVEPTMDADTGKVSGAMVRRDGKVEFVALD